MKKITAWPLLWPCMVGLSLLMLLASLTMLWDIVLTDYLQGYLIHPETSTMKRVAWLLGVPLAVVLGVFFATVWYVLSRPLEPIPMPVAPPDSRTEEEKAQARREYVLEVISLGVTLDKYRQRALWDVLKQGHAFVTIRNLDPKSYPWTDVDKGGQSGGRSGSSLENAVTPLPMYWPGPAFFAGPPVLNPAKQPSETRPYIGLASSGETRSSGVSFNLFVAAGWELAEQPDRLIERVFAFFDEHPDVPFVVISSYDDPSVRDRFRMPGTKPLITDGYYVPEMPDASAMLVLARRERVDAVRGYAFDDADDNKMLPPELNQKGIARKLFLAHSKLEKTVPQPKASIGRTPTVAEWLKAGEDFTKREDIYPKTISLLHPETNRLSHFKPTPWFPVPWNKVQLAAFDGLPTLGYLHRPTFVKMVDEEGKPVTRKDKRAAVLAKGWEQALQTLPQAERLTAPSRVITATGGNIDAEVALHKVLDQWAEQGGPELDVSKAEQWIDTDRRLGNTGAATWFVQMGIGVMGSYLDGGVSAAINFRDPNEASIVFISPPSEEKRQKQKHPLGGDVLRHHSTPAIDPANYQQP